MYQLTTQTASQSVQLVTHWTHINAKAATASINAKASTFEANATQNSSSGIKYPWGKDQALKTTCMQRTFDCSANPVNITIMWSAMYELAARSRGWHTVTAAAFVTAVCVSEPIRSHDNTRMCATQSMNSRGLQQQHTDSLQCLTGSLQCLHSHQSEVSSQPVWSVFTVISLKCLHSQSAVSSQSSVCSVFTARLHFTVISLQCLHSQSAVSSVIMRSAVTGSVHFTTIKKHEVLSEPHGPQGRADVHYIQV